MKSMINILIAAFAFVIAFGIAILTGNDLGKLGGIEQLPNETDVNEHKLTELSELFMEFEDNQKQLEVVLHKKAKSLLDKDLLEDAWKTLLAFNN